MRKSIDLESFLPGSDWQRLETWAAMAGMPTLDYLKVCVRRGHALVREELLARTPLAMRPTIDDADIDCQD